MMRLALQRQIRGMQRGEATLRLKLGDQDNDRRDSLTVGIWGNPVAA